MKQKLTAATLVLAVGPFFASPAQAEEEPKSLYDRLGGLKSLTPVVEDFVNHLIFNSTINKNPAIGSSRQRTPPSYLKFQFAQLLCEMSGGPCVYSGLPMKEAHAPLKIGPAEWEVMTAELKRSLEKFKVPAAEQAELLDLFDQTRGDIVDGSVEVAKEK